MKTAIHFQDVVKYQRGSDPLRITDLRIYEKETVAFYGLPSDQVEILVNHLTGTYIPDEGKVMVFGMDSGEVSDQTWFEFLENFGIYNREPLFQENASVGENVASLYRARNETIEEPQLSASVLQLANLVQLTITDLGKMMSEASPSLRMKIQLSRALAFSPRILIVCEPTNGTNGTDSQAAHQFIDLLKRVRRRLKFLLILFSSDVWLIEEIADRVVLLNTRTGDFVENQLRGWYHKLLPFLRPQPERLFQLTRDILQHGRVFATEKVRGMK